MGNTAEMSRKYRWRTKQVPIQPPAGMVIQDAYVESVEYWQQILKQANDGTSRLLDLYIGRAYAPRGGQIAIGIGHHSPKANVVSEQRVTHDYCRCVIKCRISRFVARVWAMRRIEDLVGGSHE